MCKNLKVAHKLCAIFYGGFDNESSLDSMTHEKCVKRAKVTHILCASRWKMAHKKCVTGIFFNGFYKKSSTQKMCKKAKVAHILCARR